MTCEANKNQTHLTKMDVPHAMKRPFLGTLATSPEVDRLASFPFLISATSCAVRTVSNNAPTCNWIKRETIKLEEIHGTDRIDPFTVSCRYHHHLLPDTMHSFCDWPNCWSTTSKIHVGIFRMSKTTNNQPKRWMRTLKLKRNKRRLTMWLQPPFFSISDLHFGHPFVYFVMYMTVSSLSSFDHLVTKSHGIGSWWSQLQLKQNV